MWCCNRITELPVRDLYLVPQRLEGHQSMSECGIRNESILRVNGAGSTGPIAISLSKHHCFLQGPQAPDPLPLLPSLDQHHHWEFDPRLGTLTGVHLL